MSVSGTDPHGMSQILIIHLDFLLSLAQGQGLGFTEGDSPLKGMSLPCQHHLFPEFYYNGPYIKRN